MELKRFKMVIKKKGNIDIETLEGFADGQCHTTVNQIMNSIGGTLVSGGDKEEAPTSDDVKQWLNI